MRYSFLSDEWFTKVDELIAAAGDLQIPPEMKVVEVNVTVTSPAGETKLFMKDGLFTRGHRPDAPHEAVGPADCRGIHEDRR